MDGCASERASERGFHYERFVKFRIVRSIEPAPITRSLKPILDFKNEATVCALPCAAHCRALLAHAIGARINQFFKKHGAGCHRLRSSVIAPNSKKTETHIALQM